jgi:pimeloyl-ACP methyl ester carboxylesterase
MLNFQPIFFPTERGHLYGVHHFPKSGQANDRAVLIMAPMGQDYVRAHKTLQKLAVDLARRGFHVLRFDYIGTGDSSDTDDWDLATWKRNSLDALGRLSGLSHAVALSIVGVRLGASIAAALDTVVDSLVLWDPVTDGSDYLDELRSLNVELLRTTLHSARKADRADSGVDDELVGHKCTVPMQESLRAFALAESFDTRSNRLLWIESKGRQSPEGHLPPNSESERSHRQLEMDCHWNSRAELDKTLMGQPAIGAVLEFLDGRSSDAGRSA